MTSFKAFRAMVCLTARIKIKYSRGGAVRGWSNIESLLWYHKCNPLAVDPLSDQVSQVPTHLDPGVLSIYLKTQSHRGRSKLLVLRPMRPFYGSMTFEEQSSLHWVCILQPPRGRASWMMDTTGLTYQVDGLKQTYFQLHPGLPAGGIVQAA